MLVYAVTKGPARYVKTWRGLQAVYVDHKREAGYGCACYHPAFFTAGHLMSSHTAFAAKVYQAEAQALVGAGCGGTPAGIEPAHLLSRDINRNTVYKYDK